MRKGEVGGDRVGRCGDIAMNGAGEPRARTAMTVARRVIVTVGAAGMVVRHSAGARDRMPVHRLICRRTIFRAMIHEGRMGMRFRHSRLMSIDGPVDHPGNARLSAGKHETDDG